MTSVFQLGSLTYLSQTADRCPPHPRIRAGFQDEVGRAVGEQLYITWTEFKGQRPVTKQTHQGKTGSGIVKKIGHTGSAFPDEQTDEVTDGGLAFSEVMEASGGRFFGLLSGRKLIQSQMILMLKEFPRSWSETWHTTE